MKKYKGKLMIEGGFTYGRDYEINPRQYTYPTTLKEEKQFKKEGFVFPIKEPKNGKKA